MRYFLGFFLVCIITIGISCKKGDTSPVDEESMSKPTPVAESNSATQLFVNGSSFSVSDTIVRDSVARNYKWIARGPGSGCAVIIEFSKLVPVYSTYSIVNVNLQNSQLECFFGISTDSGGGFAGGGKLTIIPGNPDRVSFSNLLYSGTLSNSPFTYTVSGTLPFYY